MVGCRGLEARLAFETGAFAEGSIEGIAAILTVGPYRWDAHEVVAYGVETNRVGTGAYRAPGATQATFALEQLIDELAARLEIDPIELRRRNLVAPDDEMADGTRVGRHRPRRMPRPGRRRIRSGAIARRSRMAKASGWPSGAWPGGRQPASAICRLEADGRVTVVTGVVDISGTMTGFATIAAEGLGIGRRGRFGRLGRHGVRAALAGQWRERHHLLDRPGRPCARPRRCARRSSAYAALLLEIDVRDLELVDGVVRRKGTPERGMTLAEIGERARRASARHSSRSRAMAGSVPPVLAPLTVGPPGPRPGRPRHAARSRSSTTSSPRTSAGRSTRRSSRASSTVARPRASAGRSARRWSTTTRASC